MLRYRILHSPTLTAGGTRPPAAHPDDEVFIQPLKTAQLQVGVWDISARLAHLYQLVEHMNGLEAGPRFLEVVASVPLGLEANRERLQGLVEEKQLRLQRGLGDDVDLNNIVANDVFPRLRRIRVKQRLDYLIGLVGPRIFDDDLDWQDEPDANLLATWREREALVSVGDLARYARDARRSLEAAVGFLLLTPLACMVQGRTLVHMDTRGCLFDYSDKRTDLIHSLKAFRLCDECGKTRFKRGLKVTLDKLLQGLREFKPAS